MQFQIEPDWKTRSRTFDIALMSVFAA